jgi:glycosyltransferase involved in cell wall biosynthesis
VDGRSVPPLISVVTATYNRSRVLALALDTARRQTVSDFEHWVIGDGCTDDSGDVVRALGDERFHWHNLQRNVGEQSVPNNEGIARARGRYVAFLNHDDLWWPDHLEALVSALERTGADGAVAYCVGIGRGGALYTALGTAAAQPAPWTVAPASLWLIRREALDRVGAMRRAHECWLAPTQDWLFRARRAGLDFVFSRRITALVIASTVRRGSYTRAHSPEHEDYHRRLVADPERLRLELATDLAHAYAGRWHRPRPPLFHLDRLSKDAVRLGAIRMGLTAGHAESLRWRRRGGLIEALRRYRGLGQ